MPLFSLRLLSPLRISVSSLLSFLSSLWPLNGTALALLFLCPPTALSSSLFTALPLPFSSSFFSSSSLSSSPSSPFLSSLSYFVLVLVVVVVLLFALFVLLLFHARCPFP